MRVILERAAVILLAALIISFAGDWLQYRYHAAHGSAFDSVEVKEFIAVPLKNGKYEIDYTGSDQVACVRTIYPWAGDNPCWWLRRHAERGINP